VYFEDEQPSRGILVVSRVQGEGGKILPVTFTLVRTIYARPVDLRSLQIFPTYSSYRTHILTPIANMVCAKCQKTQKTILATPGVKRKNEMYHGSPAGSKLGDKDKSKSSATMGSTGIGKVRGSRSLARVNLHSLFRP